MKRIFLTLIIFLSITTPAFARGWHHRYYQHQNQPPVITPAPLPTPVPPPTTPPPPIVPLVSTSIKYGAFMGGVGTIDMQFVGWNQIPSCGAKTQFVYWENQGLMLDAIISGAQDSVIRNFAAHVCPGMYLSVFHEMNGNWDTWDGTIGNNTPTKVIQAYRHIHDIIGNKVIWAWVVNNISVPNWAGNQIADYWPGSAYVDITGVDAFTYSGESFAQAVPPTLLATLNTFGKPVWITSIGTNHDKNAWVKDMMAKLPSTGVKGVLYFNYAEWQLDSATLSLIH